ncbi:MAG: C25 family cysteine peptidase [Acidobacteriota bacterium]
MPVVVVRVEAESTLRAGLNLKQPGLGSAVEGIFSTVIWGVVALGAPATRPMRLRLTDGSRFLTLLVAIACLIGALPSHAEEPRLTLDEDPRDPTRVTLTIQVPAPSWRDNAVGIVPVIAGFGRLGEVGAPDLPVRNQRVALPPGGELSIADLEISWEEGMLPRAVAPFPSEGSQVATQLDSRFDEPVTWWPSQPVTLVASSTYYRSLRFGTLQIVPVQIDSRQGRFRVARTIKLLLERDALRQADLRSFAPPSSRVGPLDRELEVMSESFAVGASTVGRGSSQAGAPSRAADAPLTPPTFPAWQFELKQDGLYRVTYAWAQANAPALLTFLTANDPRKYRLTVQGIEIPIKVEGESDGVFGPGDAIVFYGQAIGAVDLYSPDVFQSGDYTDTNVYRLDIFTGAKRIVARTGTGAPNGVYQVPASFRYTVRYEQNLRFFGTIPQDGTDHWYADSFSSSTTADGTSQEQSVPTPDYASGSVSVRVKQLGLKPSGNPSYLHRSQVWVDGVLRNTADWDGYREFVQGQENGAISFTPASLAPLTKVQIKLPFPPRNSSTADSVNINWVEIDYDRRYQVQSDALLFDVDNADREPHLAGTSALAEVWEITKSSPSAAGMAIVLPERVPNAAFTAGETRFTMQVDGTAPAKRRFVAAGPSGYLLPSAVREDQAPSTLDASLGSSLQGAGSGADWVIVGYRSFLDMTAGSRLRQLLTQRQGQGLDTAVIDIRDVYDEFSDGIEDPEAIKKFMSYAMANWSPAPSYLVLVGDATRDYKNFYGNSPSRQFVPTHMVDVATDQQLSYYLSDTWFAATAPGSEIPQAAVSRVPVRTLAEAEEVFRKLVAYETTAAPSSWSGRALLVSENDPDGFFAVHNAIWDEWFSGTAGPQVATKVYEAAQDDCVAMNSSIDSNVNLGAGLMTYAGHGGYQVWGRGTCGFFNTKTSGVDDLTDINNPNALNFQVQANCITGHFAQDNSSTGTDSQIVFMEDWLVTPNKGAVGGMAPSHLAFGFELDTILNPLYEEVWGPHKARLVGEIDRRMRRDFDTFNKTILLRSFVTFGDPATRLRMPAPATTTITAINKAASGQLAVTWNSVAGATKYRLFRATSPTGPYTRVTETTGLGFTDAGLSNCSEYYYYATAVDASNFESRWSNFNLTCNGTRDPQDCKAGIPENPVAPAAPTLLSVNDTQRGGQLEAVWNNATREPDVTQYTVLWGTTPGNYNLGQKSTAATSDRLVIGGLTDGTSYYVVVRAENCSKAGANSTEKSGVPHRVEGLNPPRSTWDLRVFKDPDVDGTANVKLTWSAPTQTVWGTATSAASVEVYGNQTGPVFAIDVAHRIGTAAGTATQFIHANQFPSTTGNWYYLIVTIDGSGQRSAAGTELPDGIPDLRLQKQAGNQLRLTWSPIAQSLPYPGQSSGHRLRVTGYNVYGQAGNLPRSSCSAGNRRASDLVTSDVTLPAPPDAYYTYQVLAKDSYGSEAVW